MCRGFYGFTIPAGAKLHVPGNGLWFQANVILRECGMMMKGLCLCGRKTWHILPTGINVKARVAGLKVRVAG